MTLVGSFASQLGVPSFIAKVLEKGTHGKPDCPKVWKVTSEARRLRPQASVDAALMPSSSRNPSQRAQGDPSSLEEAEAEVSNESYDSDECSSNGDDAFVEHAMAEGGQVDSLHFVPHEFISVNVARRSRTFSTG
eukprot:CAMPEP_0181518844 /NCGR_PEP_ID=MMETSP1110-20121109/65474_1 /TAXON_ID=174948 /ORGANISM="Symbiodinium sp., Strain CCMP421" /LENGTH=134 /DNA_ID=CAMNT_0023649255 /DNA_START=52 /DNA_END=456 /DNA_ORIENTATION=+